MMLSNSSTGYALGNGGLAFIGLYILTLIGIGWLGHRAKKEDSLEDHYLGGRAFGFSAIVVVGDENGVVGQGLGKSKEVSEAIAKAVEDAKKNLVRTSDQQVLVQEQVIQ